MAERDRENKPGQRHSANEQRAPDRSAKSDEHRLRGNELADDFVDADADSSVVTPHRIDKESDS